MYFKRDDLIDPLLNGNKARKFYTLWNTPEGRYNHLFSWGGNQSNAMRALAYICSRKNWKFTYFTPPLPRWLIEQPIGNLADSLNWGIELVETANPEITFQAARNNKKSSAKDFFVDRGGASPISEKGVSILAQELRRWFNETGRKMPLFLSSGTGTTAFYLSKHLPEAEVYTTPIAGDKSDLEHQIADLAPDEKNSLHIIDIPEELMVPFARPSEEIYNSWKYWSARGIQLDLIYDSTAWHYLTSVNHPLLDSPFIFILSGGVEGNISQFRRYQRDFPSIFA